LMFATVRHRAKGTFGTSFWLVGGLACRRRLCPSPLLAAESI
jgi:hypothetical protein